MNSKILEIILVYDFDTTEVVKTIFDLWDFFQILSV